MNRAEKIHALFACDQLARALRRSLNADAEREYADQGIVPSWKAPGITASGSTSKPSVAVVDEPAFLAWVAKRYPTEVETIQRVRPAWQGQFFEGVVSRGAPACDPQGEEIPGVEWRPGGTFGSISLTASRDTKALIGQLADEIAAGTRPLELPTVAEVPQP
ncbi:hypothetical protein [Micromonospora costi]|uniref:Uncharacterized protein n=1 Tax=Micromonospora costi TaxID=1530042 RepID=A0A3B0A676_9ACTN|nr:hypothetical protein [Micromonospora costi]RKN55909.1 hypothetical protein D7193_15065 [Micromonospora costi]